MRTSTRLTVALATAAAVTATGYSVAQAAGPSASAPGALAAVGATADLDTAPTAPAQRRGRLLTPAERAQLKATGHTTVVRHTRKHGDVTLSIQIGHISSASPSAISVASRGGYVHTYTLTAATAVRERKAHVPTSDLRAGERVLVVATGDGTARRIVIRHPASRTAAPA